MPPPTHIDRLTTALRAFGAALTAKMSARTAGEPEDQLRAPVETLLAAWATVTGLSLVVKGESDAGHGIGRPDYAVETGQVLCGHIELKAPGKGADPERFPAGSHDGRQWSRFRVLPNLLYCDGNSWAIYRSGVRTGAVVRLSGDAACDGEDAATANDASRLFDLLAEFTSWQPVVPPASRELAAFLAPFARLLRDEVADALEAGEPSISRIRDEIRGILMPDATDAQFADAFAQTVTFALLLARTEGADPANLAATYDHLESDHLLMARVLQEFTLPKVRKAVSSSFAVLQRVVAAVPRERLLARDEGDDPWLFFYEHFLAAYDPALRRSAGAYYTPIQVARCQVRVAEEIVRTELRTPKGLLDEGVTVLDPAAGTGTYMLAVLAAAAADAERTFGPGAVGMAVGSLGLRLFGCEMMVGPWAVAQMRITSALRAVGASLPTDGPGVILTNTLSSPFVDPPAPTMFQEPLVEEQSKARRLKGSRRVIVLVGNPPYGRHAAHRKGENEAESGGWVRHGDPEMDAYPRPILEDFLEPARKAGHGKHLKNLYNHYVYFLRWSLWKLFECGSAAQGPGVLSLITASSWIDGDAFVGVREHLRKTCEEIRVLDLGGEGRGTHQDENVFDIKTPVAIVWAWRRNRPAKGRLARVLYARIEGTREQKFAALDGIAGLRSVEWLPCPPEPQAPFRPRARGRYATWPLLTDLMPWQIAGVQVKRTWPIAATKDVLRARWAVLLRGSDRADLFRETRDRRIAARYADIDSRRELPALKQVPASAAAPPIVRYGYRTLDRQWMFSDARLIDFPRASLWRAASDRQVHFTSLLNSQALGAGPALTCSAAVPDLHHFRGSFGGKHVLPLWRDAGATEPNVNPSVPLVLSQRLGRKVGPEDFAACVYGLLAHPAFTERLADDLRSKAVRVPIPKDPALFARCVAAGTELVWLHTYGERWIGPAKRRPSAQIPSGTARCLTPVPVGEDAYPAEFSWNPVSREVAVGAGRFGPVSAEVWEYAVSGFRVVQSWLGYRMRERKGRRSSELDDIAPASWTFELTEEFLHLLWVLERTVELGATQAALLDEVLAGEVFHAADFPQAPPELTRPPSDAGTPLYDDPA